MFSATPAASGEKESRGRKALFRATSAIGRHNENVGRFHLYDPTQFIMTCFAWLTFPPTVPHSWLRSQGLNLADNSHSYDTTASLENQTDLDGSGGERRTIPGFGTLLYALTMPTTATRSKWQARVTTVYVSHPRNCRCD